MKEVGSNKQNLREKMPGGVEDIDEQLREYRRMLEAHHRYTQKIRTLSSFGISAIDERKKDRLHDMDVKRNLLHRDLLKLALRIDKTASDVIVDLLLLDGGMREYGLDLPILSWENSLDLVNKEQLRRARKEDGLCPEYLYPNLQDHQPIEHDEVAIIVGTETSDQFDAEGNIASTYAIQTKGQEPIVDSFTFSSGFTERMTGIKKLVADHPALAHFFATGAFLFHGSTRSYGIVIKKRNLINVAGILRDNREEYLPDIRSQSSRFDIPIRDGEEKSKDGISKLLEIMATIPDEMLTYDDLGERMGDDEAKEYLKKRWSK